MLLVELNKKSENSIEGMKITAEVSKNDFFKITQPICQKWSFKSLEKKKIRCIKSLSC